jgi:hypothetical protein
MMPDDPGLVVVLSSAQFDTLGDANAANGAILGWTVHNWLDNIAGDMTTTDGVSLFGTYVFQANFDVVGDNPVDVLTFEWQPTVVDAYTVGYTTLTGFEPDDAGVIGVVWEDDGDFGAGLWPIAEADIQFLVVPGPPTAFAFLAVVCAPRPRRQDKA